MKPLVYGPSARGALRAFAEAVGGITLNDLPKPVELGWEAFSLGLLDAAVVMGRPVFFDLTHVVDLTGTLDGTGRYASTVTGAELRYLRDHWTRFMPVVQFYQNGKKRRAPWENASN